MSGHPPDTRAEDGRKPVGFTDVVAVAALVASIVALYLTIAQTEKIAGTSVCIQYLEQVRTLLDEHKSPDEVRGIFDEMELFDIEGECGSVDELNKLLRPN